MGFVNRHVDRGDRLLGEADIGQALGECLDEVDRVGGDRLVQALGELTVVDCSREIVRPGGIVVLDDFVPCEMWPPITGGRVDTLREEWLTDERFTTVEVMVAPDASALVGTRR